MIAMQNEMSEQFWINWLKAASLVVTGFGLMVAAAAHPSGAGVTMFFAAILIWPFDGNPAEPEQITRLLSAIGGGVMVGWGVLLWMLVSQVMPRMPEVARRMILISIVTWFVIDSTGSVVSGVPLNVAGNLVFLIAFLVPLRALGSARNGAVTA